MQSVIPENALRSGLVKAGLAYWLAKKGNHPLPSRQAFDPICEVPGLTPNIMLKDVQRDPLDFRYRLVGSDIRRHLKSDPTGRWMSAIPGQGPGNPLWEHHAHAVAERAPVFLRPAYVGPHKEFLQIESVLLPLAGDHEQPDMLLIFTDFLRAPDAQKGDAQKGDAGRGDAGKKRQPDA
jgi:hypothetical protein